MKPKDMGGLATIENGQTLCSQHNFLKKNLRQTETGKKCLSVSMNLLKKKIIRNYKTFVLKFSKLLKILILMDILNGESRFIWRSLFD
ncbi:hypothetical protein [Tumidithrix elongata]|uniref:hypothetical protein n=1 Tax=Tumidithrix elongata TaxID=3088357 RepID=UPI0038CD4836